MVINWTTKNYWQNIPVRHTGTPNAPILAVQYTSPETFGGEYTASSPLHPFNGWGLVSGGVVKHHFEILGASGQGIGSAAFIAHQDIPMLVAEYVYNQLHSAFMFNVRPVIPIDSMHFFLANGFVSQELMNIIILHDPAPLLAGRWEADGTFTPPPGGRPTGTLIEAINKFSADHGFPPVLSEAGRVMPFATQLKESISVFETKTPSTPGQLDLPAIPRWMSENENVVMEIQKFYVAYYGRPGDVPGIKHWKEHLALLNGNTDQMLLTFGSPIQGEFRYLYGDLKTQDALINGVYLNLFNRPAEQAGLDHWNKTFDALEVSLGSADAARAQIVTSILNGAQGSDRTAIENKVSAAWYFSAQADADLSIYSLPSQARGGREFISAVTYDQSVLNKLIDVDFLSTVGNRIQDNSLRDDIELIGVPINAPGGAMPIV